MGTLSVQIRNEGLKGMVGQSPGVDKLEIIGLSSGATIVNQLRENISWQTVSGGEVEQDGTITFEIDLTGTSSDAVITGFTFYNANDQSRGSGFFQETVTLDAGFEYTVNVSGIKVTLPE